MRVVLVSLLVGYLLLTPEPLLGQGVDTLSRASPAEVYRTTSSAVVQVVAGLPNGSGFFVETGEAGRLVVTNDHVLGNARSVSVMLDSARRYPAEVAVRDQQRDLALLRVHPDVCPSCAALEVPDSSEFRQLTRPGRRVVAVGFPSTQSPTVTEGVVSGLRQGLVVSDVSLNRGNSGGPLIALNRRLVGVSTFVQDDEVGQGLSGAVAATELRQFLNHAEDSIAQTAVPDAKMLPTLPHSDYPLPQLQELAESYDPSRYSELLGIDADNFRISVTTPVVQAVGRVAVQQALTANRREREQNADIEQQRQYDVGEVFRNWKWHVGNTTTPVVGVRVTPTIGEPFGSAIQRALVGGIGTLEFEGDVQRVEFYSANQTGERLQPIMGGRKPVQISWQGQTMQMSDMANEGFYILDPRAFRPDSSGAPPNILVQIHDLANPEDSLSNWVELPARAVATAWNDFVPYFRSLHPDSTYQMADPLQFESKCWQGAWPADGLTSINKQGQVWYRCDAP